MGAGDGVDLAIGEPVVINPYLSCGKCIACRHGKPNCCVRIEVLGVHRDGAMCERILVPAQNLYPANGLSLADAAAVEFLAIGAHAVRRARVSPVSMRWSSAPDPIRARRSHLRPHRRAGCDAARHEQRKLPSPRPGTNFPTLDGSRGPVPDLVKQATSGEGFDVVFKRHRQHLLGAVGLRPCRAWRDTGAGQRRERRYRLSDPEFHKREMTLIGSRNALRSDFHHVAASIRNGAVPMAKLVTHRTSLAVTPRNLARWAHEKSGLIKAVIEVR